MPQWVAVANSSRRLFAVLLTSEPVQVSTPPTVIAATERRFWFHGSRSPRQATSVLQAPDLQCLATAPNPV